MPDKILCGLTVKGRTKSHSFVAEIDVRYLKEWLDDGLDISLKHKPVTDEQILCGLITNGREKQWSFHVFVEPDYLDKCREDGLDIDPIVEIIEGKTWIDKQADDLLKGEE